MTGTADNLKPLSTQKLVRVLAKSPHPDAPPIYFVAGIGGHVMPYRPLAKQLARHHPVFGFISPSVYSPAPADQMSDLVDPVVAELE